MTIFSFGYYGWGNSTARLVEAADAVERSRGFRPPIFADIRIRRQGRAAGFVGAAFEELLGRERHHWMPRLGNRRIVTRSGPPIQIADPAAAAELLDVASEADHDGRRVIFFCGCEFPKKDGAVSCHRYEVTRLLLATATRRQQPIEIVEWPGGEPRHIELETPPNIWRSVRKGRTTIPIGDRLPLAAIAGLPWGSTATLIADGQRLHRLVASARWKQNGWCLPVVWRQLFERAVTLDDYQRHAEKARRAFGMEPSSSKSKR